MWVVSNDLKMDSESLYPKLNFSVDNYELLITKNAFFKLISVLKNIVLISKFNLGYINSTKNGRV